MSELSHSEPRMPETDLYTRYRSARMMDEFYPPAEGEQSAVEALDVELLGVGHDFDYLVDARKVGIHFAEQDIQANQDAKDIEHLDFPA